MDEISRSSHEYWSGRAEEFSGLRMKEYETPMRGRLIEFIRPLLPDKKSLEALDVGCGAGFLTLLLLELGCSVTAIDFSAEMLGQAQKNCLEKGFSKGVLFQQADAGNLPFPDGSFDFVISRNVTWTLPNAKDACLEMFRVLRSGGVLLNMDANYGKAFNEADARGETPSHPTQTLDQLRTRNEIARDLDVTKADRPLWDFSVFWGAGASEITIQKDLMERLSIEQYDSASAAAPKKNKSGMFAVIVKK